METVRHVAGTNGARTRGFNNLARARNFGGICLRRILRFHENHDAAHIWNHRINASIFREIDDNSDGDSQEFDNGNLRIFLYTSVRLLDQAVAGQKLTAEREHDDNYSMDDAYVLLANRTVIQWLYTSDNLLSTIHNYTKRVLYYEQTFEGTGDGEQRVINGFNVMP
ncbi:hypothetical protein EVAR_10371_1 [Eumeta japonica]|uniref:Uncharacterized protein n=1 Tax=Eumeta variegata TaxID=151549 RepID=A0A4C1UCP6_EUMVA|nr:hypothetical protein EVAR_10371_1 [Eumeta japonica]